MASRDRDVEAKQSDWVVLLGDGVTLDKDRLKEEVKYCSKLLASSDTSELLQGSEKFYHLIMAVWSLDTSLAVDAADLVCDTVRFVTIVIIIPCNVLFNICQ